MRWILALAALAVLGGGAWWLLTEREPGTDPATGPLERADGERDRGPRLEGAAADTHAGGVATGRGVLVGRVTRAGAPAVASVETRRLGGPEITDHERRRSLAPLTEGFRVVEAPRAERTTRSDGQGAFEVAGLAAGLHHVVARAADGAEAWANVLLAGEGARVEVELALLAADLVLAGTARYEDGRPFAGSLVVLPHGAPPTGTRRARVGDEGARSSVVGGDGSFRVAGLPAGGASVRVLAQDGSLATTFLVTLPARSPTDLVIPAGKERLTGRVLGAEGDTPVAGATVVVSWNGPGSTSVRHLLTSDADGRFATAFGGLTAFLEAQAEGHGRTRRTADRSTGEVVLRLVRVAKIAGRVATKEGAPAAGAVVLASTARSDGAVKALATPDAKGHYVFESLAAGEVTLVVRGGGWTSPGLGDASEQGFNPFRHVVRAGTSATIDLVAVAGARLEGRVTDAAGAPVAGATLRADLSAPWPDTRSLLVTSLGGDVAVSGPDGAFAFDGLVDGSSYEVSAEAAGQARTTLGPFAVRADTRVRADVRFPPARYVDVIALFEDDGSPVEGAKVTLEAKGERRPEPGHRRGTTPAAWTTDAQGRARAGPVGPGELFVEVKGDPVAGGGTGDSWYSSDGNPPAPKGTPVPGSAEGAGPFELTVRVGRGLTIEGRVLRADGSPVAGASLFAMPAGGNSATGGLPSGPDGAFLVRALAPGRHKVSASLAMGRQRYAKASVDVEAGTRGVTLTLEDPEPTSASSMLLLRVLDERGEPVHYAHVQVRQGNGTSGTTLQHGVLQFEPFRQDDGPSPSLEGARVTVWGALGADGLPLGAGVGHAGPLAAGQTEVVIRLPAGKGISGRVLLDDGTPLAGVRVSAAAKPDESQRRGNAGSGWAYSDATGSFRITGIGEGPHMLEVRAAPDLVQAEPVDAQTGDDRVEIRLRRGLRAVVRVVDDRGALVSGASVNANPIRAAAPPGASLHERQLAAMRDGSRLYRNATTAADGTIVLRGLEPTITWKLSVRPPKGRDDLQPWEQEPWVPGDVEVPLGRGYVVAGRVVDGQGKPVKNAYVRYRVGEKWMQTQQTPADGSFRIVGLAPGPVVLLPNPPGTGRRSTPMAEVTVQAGAEDVTLAIDPGANLVVRVANAERRGDQRHVTATLFERTEQGGLQHAGWSDLGSGGARLVFEGLKPGTSYTVWIPPERTEWYGLATDVRAGGDEVVVSLERGGSISGRVTFPSGAVNVGVSVVNELGLHTSGNTDDQGHYEIRGLPPGTWTVRAHGRLDGRTWRAEGKVAAGGTLDLVLEERVR